jgi:hypothetical protein
MQADELARALGVSPGDLERVAVLAQLQLNYSQLCGQWIRRDQLHRWQAAAKFWRGR